MAFRMTRGGPKLEKEPMRKKRKLNTLFDIDDVGELSKKAEISISKSLTADERRIETGKRLLAAAQQAIPISDDEDGGDESDKEEAKQLKIHSKLMGKIIQLEGKYRYRLAYKLRDYISEHKDINCKIKTIRGHRLSVTCMALDPTGKDRYVITGSKDGSVIKWDLNTGQKVKKIWHAWPIKNKNRIHPKTGKQLRWGGLRYEVYKKIRPKPVLALAISPDEKWLVSGGEDTFIRVWHAKTMRYRSTFKGGHRKKVTGLAFARDDNRSKVLDDCGTNNTLFSTGADRQIRVYDMNEMGFAEPLYGHTEGINSIDTTNEDRCLTVSDDKTVRYWKLRTQSQLIFSNGHDETIDACCLLTPGRFVTGSQDGSVALWTTTKKYPLHKLKDVHLTNNKLDIKDKDSKLRHWIVSLSAKHNCDVFASGSSDGVIKLWAVKNNSFTHLRSIKIPKCGFINTMKWTEKGDKIICGIGDEHRLGRWEHIKGVKNGIAIIKLPISCMDSTKDEAEDDDLKDSNNDKKKEIVYEEAVTWDKWNPKERGEHISDDEEDNIKKKKNKDNKGVDAFLEDDDEDEWTSFFGNVFR